MTKDVWTDAAFTADNGMEVVDGIMSFISGDRGKPSKEQRALYVAAVAFAYAVWENYVEDLAIELVEQMAPDIDPARLPAHLVERINDGLSPWELSVSPGWRSVWVERTRLHAKGDGFHRHGLSMAWSAAVKDLFGWVGIDPFAGMTPSAHRMDQLVHLRNSVVHTGQIPDDLRKADVVEWRDFVYTMYTSVDKACRGQADALADTTLYA